MPVLDCGPQATSCRPSGHTILTQIYFEKKGDCNGIQGLKSRPTDICTQSNWAAHIFVQYLCSIFLYDIQFLQTKLYQKCVPYDQLLIVHGEETIYVPVDLGNVGSCESSFKFCVSHVSVHFIFIFIAQNAGRSTLHPPPTRNILMSGSFKGYRKLESLQGF